MTQGEFVSRVINESKSLTKDDHISRRYILFTGKNKVKTYLSQKFDELSLFREDGIIQSINCLQMIPQNTVDCGIVEFSRCKSLMRSRYKLPETIFGKKGAGVVSVSTLDGTYNYKYSTVKSYARSLRRKYKSKQDSFYYIVDGYLYLPNSKTEMVDIRIISLEEKVSEQLSGCEECDECKSNWDYTFVVPDRMLEPVIRDTINEIVSINKRIVSDENPNLDSNQKQQTIQS